MVTLCGIQALKQPVCQKCADFIRKPQDFVHDLFYRHAHVRFLNLVAGKLNRKIRHRIAGGQAASG